MLTRTMRVLDATEKCAPHHSFLSLGIKYHMKVEYILFSWLLIPWAKTFINFVFGRSEQAYKEKQLKRQQRTAEKTILIGGVVMVIGAVPYIGAYFYADFKYIWLIIGIVYLIMGLFTLTMGVVNILSTKYGGEDIAQYKIKYNNKYKNVNFWPKWQVKALCLYEYIVLVLWLYSWRHIIA